MKQKLMFIIALLALVALLAVPVSAVANYNGTLEVNLPASQVITSGSASWSASITRNSSLTMIAWGTDFDIVGTPEFLVMYFPADNLAVGSTTFYLSDSLGQYASGSLLAGNGTNLYGGAGNQYYVLNFNTWTPGTRSGKIIGSLNIPNDTALTSNPSVGPFNQMSVGGSGLGTLPMAPTYSTTYVTPSTGMIYQAKQNKVKFDYFVNAIGGSGTGLISNVSIQRPSSNTLSSKFQIRSEVPPNTLKASSPFTSKTINEYLLVSGNNYFLTAYVPFNGKYYNSSILFPPTSASYILTVTPETGSLSTTYKADATSSDNLFSVCDAYTIICNGVSGGKCLYNQTDPVFIKKADTYWYHRSLINGAISDVKLTLNFPSSLSLNFTAPGFYSVDGTFFETIGGGRTASDTVTVTSTGGAQTFTVNVQDSTSGALVSGAEVQIKTSAGIWSNLTTLTGTRAYGTKTGEILGYGASATGYLPSSILYTQITGGMDRTVILNKYIPVAVGNNTLYVYARDSRTLTGLEGALIHLGDGQTKTTPASGLATFTVLENGTYQITVSKSGFQPLTRTIQVAGSSNAISMELSPIYVTTQRTLAPGETATPAPQATKDMRSNPEKQEAAVKIVYDNAEYIVWGLVALIFIGIIKLALKGWKFW